MTGPARLVDLRPGERALIRDLAGEVPLVQRLLEMGLTEDEEVEVVRFAPLGDPVEIQIRGYFLSLRKQEAAAILVEKI